MACPVAFSIRLRWLGVAPTTGIMGTMAARANVGTGPGPAHSNSQVVIAPEVLGLIQH